MVIIIKADLFDLPVDAIVCSANNWLKLGTGIAGQIKKRGGQVVQDDCFQVIKDMGGPIPIGNAIITSSGNLFSQIGHPKYIIHAIAMGYHRYDSGQVFERILATQASVSQSVNSALVIAEKNAIKTYSG